MSTYDNPLVASGEYTRLYAVEVPVERQPSGPGGGYSGGGFDAEPPF